ncbi:MAG: MBL fold metallo-hydrolase [Proteobacteria bacterium]|nr:MBL fold metallo-hydrolase [Pseudomonadota bacterium]
MGIGVAMLATPGMAQTGGTAKGAAALKGSRFITLGTTAGPLPRKDRAQASNLLIVNGTNYLIDAGDGATRRIVQAGINFLQVGTIFITHNHSDHMAGLATLLNAQWEYSRRQPTNVYGPPGTQRVVEAAIAYFTVNAEIRSTEGKTSPRSNLFIGHDVGVGPIYADANIKVTAVENTHFNIAKDSPLHGKHKSYSYRFQTPDRVIVFTGDTGPSEAVTQLATGADVLVSEVLDAEEIKQRRIRSGNWDHLSAAEQAAFMAHLIDEHVTPEEVGKMAAKAGVKTLVLTHLPTTGKDNDDYKRYVDKVGKYYKGPVFVASDLMRF